MTSRGERQRLWLPLRGAGLPLAHMYRDGDPSGRWRLTGGPSSLCQGSLFSPDVCAEGLRSDHFSRLLPSPQDLLVFSWPEAEGSVGPHSPLSSQTTPMASGSRPQSPEQTQKC